LSSLASSCDHIRHVNSQMPYALTVGIVSLIVCIIPAGYGVPVWLLYPVAIGLLYLFIRKFGKRV
ncbi:MAG TPA: hypothetical protein PLM49_09415, partial [Bacteroidales bacterium]|nr:hypothetical protein [Bacteroidales bacterium]